MRGAAWGACPLTTLGRRPRHHPSRDDAPEGAGPRSSPNCRWAPPKSHRRPRPECCGRPGRHNGGRCDGEGARVLNVMPGGQPRHRLRPYPQWRPDASSRCADSRLFTMAAVTRLDKLSASTAQRAPRPIGGSSCATAVAVRNARTWPWPEGLSAWRPRARLPHRSRIGERCCSLRAQSVHIASGPPTLLRRHRKMVGCAVESRGSPVAGPKSEDLRLRPKGERSGDKQRIHRRRARRTKRPKPRLADSSIAIELNHKGGQLRSE